MVHRQSSSEEQRIWLRAEETYIIYSSHGAALTTRSSINNSKTSNINRHIQNICSYFKACMQENNKYIAPSVVKIEQQISLPIYSAHLTVSTSNTGKLTLQQVIFSKP